MTTDPNDGIAVKDLQQLVDRYLALWNEPDPEIRHRGHRSCGPPTWHRCSSTHRRGGA